MFLESLFSLNNNKYYMFKMPTYTRLKTCDFKGQSNVSKIWDPTCWANLRKLPKPVT